MPRREAVILLHGLWMSRPMMAWLGGRLRRCGYDVYYFSYHSVRDRVEDNADRLFVFQHRLEASCLHYVGHSLGGRVVLQMFQRHPMNRPGRIVTLCTPYAANAAAVILQRSRLGRWVAGYSLEELTRPAPVATGRDIGAVAGTVGIGLGRLLGSVPVPNDGSVAVAEIVSAPVSDVITVAASHSSILFSEPAAAQVCQFLRTGRFGRDSVNDGRAG